MTREQAIIKASEHLEEDVTEVTNEFEKEEERAEIDGTDFFHVISNRNWAVRVETAYDEEKDEISYEIITDSFAS